MKRLPFILFFLLAVFLVPIFKANANLVVPIKILLVPGHDKAVWGARYGNTKEADMTLALATKIYDTLKQDKRFDVHITRDQKGYTAEFANFLEQKDAILTFQQNAKKLMQGEIASGGFVKEINPPPHHSVSEDIALRLYGFNKWANENKMDAVVHVHFNGYPLPSKWSIGKYQGFTIYYPDKQFANAKGSLDLATSIFTQLHKKYTTSNYKPEAGGLTSDQELIAVGAYGTLDASIRSVLIEYGYIYEKKFRTKSAREQSYKNMASLTVAGLDNYFFGK